MTLNPESAVIHVDLRNFDPEERRELLGSVMLANEGEAE